MVPIFSVHCLKYAVVGFDKIYVIYRYCTAVFGTEFWNICSDWDCQFASASSDNENYDFLGRGYNINQGSFKNEFHYLSPILKDGKFENINDSSNGRDIRDCEVRMDLTDDLLHMVLVQFFFFCVCVCVFIIEFMIVLYLLPSLPLVHHRLIFWHCSSWW